MIHSLVLGIDVSKDKLDCSMVDVEHDKRLWYLVAPNTPAGIATIFAKADPSVALVAEPTGPYTLELAKRSVAAGRTLYMAPTRQAKAFSNSRQSRAKTDNINSYDLALFGASRQLKPYPIKSDLVEELDSLLSYRKVLSGTISRMQAQANTLPRVAELIAADLKQTKKMLANLDKQIKSLTHTTPQLEAVKRLEQVPGIGSVIAPALASRLLHKDFDTPDQFVAYVGLDVGIIQSGKRKGQLGLTKQGDAELRRLLYCAAQANLRCKSDTPFKSQYYREKAKGHTHKQAMCAVGRKLAKLAWSMVKHATAYDPERVFVQPKPSVNKPQSAGLPGEADVASSTRQGSLA